MVNVPQIRGLQIVLLGDFNPTIFQPAWFAREGLLTDEEASDASIGLIHPDVTSFELSWFRCTVERERFTAISLAQPYFERLATTVCSLFDLLNHTPITMMGLNFEAHFRAATLEKWHALGHKLAPKDFWTKYFTAPGMQDVTIRQLPRPDGIGGHVQICVQPSAHVNPGIYIAIKDHFQDLDGSALGAQKAVDLIRDKWVERSEFAEQIFQDLSTEVA